MEPQVIYPTLETKHYILWFHFWNNEKQNSIVNECLCELRLRANKQANNNNKKQRIKSHFVPWGSISKKADKVSPDQMLTEQKWWLPLIAFILNLI